jgi:DnaK suppressor protein
MQRQETIRKKLLNRYAEIQNRLSKITRDVRHAEEPLLADFAEQATQRENDEVLNALDNSIRSEMSQIEQTLLQMNAGRYGLCEVCGKHIAAKRLEALPYATRCVNCEALRQH